jgi:hypothetical protein
MENDSAPSTQPVSNQEGQPESSAGFDGYRSVSDPNLMIFVAKDVVPPFRFKAGGWELFQSSTDLGSAMKARIGEKGFFLFRANEDRTGGVELSDPQTPFAGPGTQAEGN